MNDIHKKNNTLEGLCSEYSRLIFPLEGHYPNAGKQMSDGRGYPNVNEYALEDHFNGKNTFAFDILHKDENGTELCKVGVLDIDDLENADSISQELVATAAEFGIRLNRAFSGGKGIHCILYTDALVPKQAIVTVLKSLKKRVPFQGDLIPGDNYRIKTAPCFHQSAHHVSYFLKDDEVPQLFESTQDLEGMLSEQLEIMRSIIPTNANVIMALARNLDESRPATDYESAIPDLKALPQDALLTPCMKAFLEKGGSAVLGSYDKQNLILLNYCNSVGFTPEQAEIYAFNLAENTNPDITTGKSVEDKIKHWGSIQGASSAQYQFSCPRILSAKKDLAFNCGECPVRPEGVWNTARKAPSGSVNESSNSGENSHPSSSLPHELSGHLLSQMMGLKANLVNIDEPIFADKTDRAIHFAIRNDNFNPTEIIHFLHQVPKKALQRFLPPKQSKDDEPDVDGFIKKCDARLEELRKYVMSNAEAEKLFKNARELTIYIRTSKVLWNTHAMITDKVAAANILETAHDSIKTLLRTDQDTFKNQQAYLEEFINYLGGCGQKIPTGIALLDQELGGGLASGTLAIIASPPGGGKTTEATQMADFIASNGIPVCYVSMEMPRNHLSLRSLSRIGSINSRVIEKGSDNLGSYAQRVQDALSSYAEVVAPNLYILEGNESITPAKIQAAIANIRAQRELPEDSLMVVIIDYLQLLDTGNPALDNGPNENAKISELAWKIKSLASQNNVAIVAISDVTKEEQSHANSKKGMTLGALRGSNRIAHSADYVIMIYSGQRDQDSEPDQDTWSPITKVNGKSVVEKLKSLRNSKLMNNLDAHPVLSRLEILKNRFGVKGAMIPLIYEKGYHRFRSVLEENVNV